MSLSNKYAGRLLFGLSVAVLIPQSLSAQAPDSLWTKAVAIAAANQNWVPTRWHQDEVVYDRKGKVEETSRLELLLDGSEDGEWGFQILSATKNGNDNREAATREVEAHGESYLTDQPEDNPFAPAVQHTVTATRSDRVEYIDGRAYVAFDYVQKTAERQWTGVAWLDAETGVPGRLELTTEDLPIEEDGLEIEALASTTHYNVSAPGAWYPLKVELDVGFKARYVVFTFRGTAKTVLTLSGYERL